MPSFSTTLEQSIHAALALANARRHELATLEHLLLALIEEPDAARVMRACAVDLDELRKSLRDGKLPEDDERRALADVEELTTGHTEQIDRLGAQKEAELLEI